MSTKFTPGPWRASWSMVGQWLVYMGGRQCEMALPADRKADAHLIAAAPELYEALHELLRSHVESWREEGYRVDDDEEVIAARAALAKARGEA